MYNIYFIPYLYRRIRGQPPSTNLYLHSSYKFLIVLYIKLNLLYKIGMSLAVSFFANAPDRA